jgi:hypothetical protein
MIALDIKFDKDLKKLVNQFQAAFPGEMDTVVKNVAADAMGKIMIDTPVKTGNLRLKWYLKKVKDSEWFIKNDVKYAAPVEYGSRPHDIEGNPFLYFKNEEGKLIRKHKVHHPGKAAVKMMRNQIPYIQSQLVLKSKEMIQRLWKQAFGSA